MTIWKTYISTITRLVTSKPIWMVTYGSSFINQMLVTDLLSSDWECFKTTAIYCVWVKRKTLCIYTLFFFSLCVAQRVFQLPFFLRLHVMQRPLQWSFFFFLVLISSAAFGQTGKCFFSNFLQLFL